MPGTLVRQINYPNGRRFEVVIYDLLAEPTDAIVNAANGGLSHGGGVAAAISKAAGCALDEEGNRIVRERGRIPPGEAVVTTAGRLPFKGVIHAVGPRLGEGNEEEKIVQALKAGFLRARARLVFGLLPGHQLWDVLGALRDLRAGLPPGSAGVLSGTPRLLRQMAPTGPVPRASPGCGEEGA